MKNIWHRQIALYNQNGELVVKMYRNVDKSKGKGFDIQAKTFTYEGAERDAALNAFTMFSSEGVCVYFIDEKMYTSTTANHKKQSTFDIVFESVDPRLAFMSLGSVEA